MQRSVFGIELSTIPTKSQSRSRNLGSRFGIEIPNFEIWEPKPVGFAHLNLNRITDPAEFRIECQKLGFWIGIDIEKFGIWDWDWKIWDSASGFGIEFGKIGIRDWTRLIPGLRWDLDLECRPPRRPPVICRFSWNSYNKEKIWLIWKISSRYLKFCWTGNRVLLAGQVHLLVPQRLSNSKIKGWGE